MNNLISVLLPFHNAASFLERAVRSAADQAFEQKELVLVNNASTDDSLAIAQRLQHEYNFVKLVEEPCKGIAYALNTGLNHCTGNYLARMDADDVMLAGRLQAQFEFLEAKKEIGLAGGLVAFESEVADARGYEAYVKQINEWQSEDDIYHHRFVESPFAHPSVMFRRSLIESYGSYSTGPYPEDYELWLRWMHHGVRMAKVPVPVLLWKDRADRLSRTHENCSPEAFDTVRYNYLGKWMNEKRERLRPVYVWGGKLARKKAKLLEAQGITVRGYIDVKAPDQPDTIHFSDIPAAGEIFILSMVSNRGKFAEVRDFLLERGYVIGKDFVLAG